MSSTLSWPPKTVPLYCLREGRSGTARKRHSDEDILKLLREIALKLNAGDDVASACRGVGISDATYYN